MHTKVLNIKRKIDVSTLCFVKKICIRNVYQNFSAAEMKSTVS